MGKSDPHLCRHSNTAEKSIPGDIDFFSEIASHLRWRTFIESLMNNPLEKDVPTSQLIRDDHCQLGQWIYSEASNQFDNNIYFKKLIHVHKRFHLMVGTIMSAQGSGKDIAQDLEAFYQLSNEVIFCLEQLSDEVMSEQSDVIA